MFDQIQSFGARRIAVVVLAAGLVGVVAVPSILAASAPPTVAQVGQPAPVAAAKPAAFGRVLRGDATVLKRDGTTTTVHFERGEITAASATSVTIKGADGVSKTFAIGPDTRIRSQGKETTHGCPQGRRLRGGLRHERRLERRRAAGPRPGRQADPVT